MLKTRILGLKKLLAATVAVLVMAPAALALTTGASPLITADSANPNPYDPNSSVNFGNVTVQYYLNVDAVVHVEMLDTDGSTVIVNGGISTLTGGSFYEFDWDGQQSGSVVSNGTYFYHITATNTYGTDEATGAIVVNSTVSPGTAPTLTNVNVSPDPFNPDTQNTDVDYTLDKTADVSLEVFDCSARTSSCRIDSSTQNGVGSGSRTFSWDGRNSSSTKVSAGTYYLELTACNSYGCDTANDTVRVDYGTTSGNLNVTSYVTPNPFNPDNEDAKIVVTSDDIADDMYVEVRVDSDWMKLDEEHDVDSANFYWDGRNTNNDLVSNGAYSYRATACNSSGCDTDSGTINVTDSGSNNNFDDDYGTLIDNVDITDEIFDPTDSERAKLTWDVEMDSVYVTVNILELDEDVIKKLIEDKRYDKSTNNTSYWNGRNNNNSTVKDAVYVYHIHAEKIGKSDEDGYRYVEVDTDGKIIGFPNKNGSSCAGFTDVNSDNPYCKAIELMKVKGIFDGYSDGTFRLYEPINRAETTKVVLLAIGYSLMSDDGTNLGFWDVVKKAWYMTYLRTGKAHGIIRGYPDGSFRPGITPNRVELLKIFLEGTGVNIPYCNVAPYNDTQVNDPNGIRNWYIDYVCFAANNNLMYADGAGNFNPAAPMARGDVAMLFYNFYVRGLYQSGPFYTGSSYGQTTSSVYYPVGGQPQYSGPYYY
jgi:flagellar hook assembly protein FlgD